MFFEKAEVVWSVLIFKVTVHTPVVAQRAAKLFDKITNINSWAVNRTKNSIWDTIHIPNKNMHYRLTENVGNTLIEIVILVSECRHHG